MYEINLPSSNGFVRCEQSSRFRVIVPEGDAGIHMTP